MERQTEGTGQTLQGKGEGGTGTPPATARRKGGKPNKVSRVACASRSCQ